MKVAKIKLGGPIQWKLPPSAPLILDVKLGPGRLVNPLVVHQTHEETSAYLMDDNLLRFSSDEMYITLESREQEDYCTEKRDEFEAEVVAFLGWVRELAFLYKIPPSAGITKIQIVDRLPEKRPFQPPTSEPRNMVVMQADALLNSIDESLAQQAARDAAEGKLVPIHRVFLVNAYAAMNRDDYRHCFLYSAMAIESLIAGNLEQEYQRRKEGAEGLDLRFVEFTDLEGKMLKKDPIYELLCLRNDLTSLLHERSLYIHNKSLLFDMPDTYRLARKLSFTRTRILQRAELDDENSDKFFSMSPLDAANALRCVAEVFKWFGERRPVFPNNKMIPACVIRWDRARVSA